MYEWYEYIGEREERELRLFRRFLKCKTGCMVYAISFIGKRNKSVVEQVDTNRVGKVDSWYDSKNG